MLLPNELAGGQSPRPTYGGSITRPLMAGTGWSLVSQPPFVVPRSRAGSRVASTKMYFLFQGSSCHVRCYTHFPIFIVNFNPRSENNQY